MNAFTRSLTIFLSMFMLAILLTNCRAANTSDVSAFPAAPAVSPAGNTAPKSCPLTKPKWIKPPDDSAVGNAPEYGNYFVNEDLSIWASAWWIGHEENYLFAGEDGIKMGWFRPAGAELEITGRLLNAPAAASPLEAHVPCCYPTRFQATGLSFPAEGCWEVTAKAAESELSFVVWVESEEELPSKQGAAPAAASPAAANSDSAYLSPALKMVMKRAAHTATLLPDGKVLIAGGFREKGTSEIPIAAAEIYDPETNSFATTGEMKEARSGHTATLLPNGQALIAGGWAANGRTASTELYDPQTGKFRYAASMFAPRASMTATLLNNGQLLIAGGDSARGAPQLVAEIYDPATNTFTQSAKLNSGRSAHTATLLNDGRVLFIGGRPRWDDAQVLASAEIYNPLTGEFTYTGDMSMVRYKHAAVLLQDGNVLVLGGSDQRDWRGQYSSAEIYDSSTATFTAIADMNNARFKLTGAAVLLNNGDVLIGGGNRQIELFENQKQRFTVAENIDDDYYFSALTLLQDGRVLITGGYDSGIQPSAKAWIYDHTLDHFAP